MRSMIFSLAFLRIFPCLTAWLIFGAQALRPSRFYCSAISSHISLPAIRARPQILNFSCRIHNTSSSFDFRSHINSRARTLCNFFQIKGTTAWSIITHFFRSLDLCLEKSSPLRAWEADHSHSHLIWEMQGLPINYNLIHSVFIGALFSTARWPSGIR